MKNSGPRSEIIKMKISLEGFNRKFEQAEESANLKTEQQRLCILKNRWKKFFSKIPEPQRNMGHN